MPPGALTLVDYLQMMGLEQLIVVTMQMETMAGTRSKS